MGLQSETTEQLHCHFFQGFGLLVTQTAKNLPAMQETWVRTLDREDPLEEEMATHSNILAWKISCTEETGRLQVTSMGVAKSRTQLCMCVHARARAHTHTHTHTHTLKTIQ